MYLTYEEYMKYGGELSESAFNTLNWDATKRIDHYTFGRLKEDTEFSESVKMAVVKIIQVISTFETYYAKVSDLDAPIVESSSNDGVSESYGGYLGNTSPQDVNVLSQKRDKDIRDIINRYLDGERNQKGQLLLYRGVYR